MTEFLLSRDPFCRQIVWGIRDIFAKMQTLPNSKRKRLRRLFPPLLRLFSGYETTFLLNPFFVEIYRQFRIFKINKTYYGVYRSAENLLLERLKYAVPAPDLFSASERANLYAKINTIGSLQPPQTAEDFLQPSVYLEELRRLSGGASGAPATRRATIREALSRVRILSAVYRPFNAMWMARD